MDTTFLFLSCSEAASKAQLCPYFHPQSEGPFALKFSFGWELTIEADLGVIGKIYVVGRISIHSH